MKNPLKFIQEVKQEAFRVTWPTGKETLARNFNGCCYGYCCFIIFFTFRSIFKVFLELLLKIAFNNEKLVYSSITFKL